MKISNSEQMYEELYVTTKMVQLFKIQFQVNTYWLSEGKVRQLPRVVKSLKPQHNHNIKDVAECV